MSTFPAALLWVVDAPLSLLIWLIVWPPSFLVRVAQDLSTLGLSDCRDSCLQTGRRAGCQGARCVQDQAPLGERGRRLAGGLSWALGRPAWPGPGALHVALQCSRWPKVALLRVHGVGAHHRAAGSRAFLGGQGWRALCSLREASATGTLLWQSWGWPRVSGAHARHIQCVLWGPGSPCHCPPARELLGRLSSPFHTCGCVAEAASQLENECLSPR